MRSRSDVCEAVELLVVTAHFHRTGAPLGLRHTKFARPLLPSARAEHGLVLLPYLDGPDLERLSAFDVEVAVHWLIPVTAAEVEVKTQHGLAVPEAAFERSDDLTRGRASVI